MTRDDACDRDMTAAMREMERINLKDRLIVDDSSDKESNEEPISNPELPST